MRSFAFFWSEMNQNITDGTLWLNMTFQRQGEYLHIEADLNIFEFNNNETYARYGSLVLTFDRNNNGQINMGEADNARIFGPDNKSSDGLYLRPNGEFDVASNFIPEPYHNYTFFFNQETGYHFNIYFPIREPKPSHPGHEDYYTIENDLVYVIFIFTRFSRSPHQISWSRIYVSFTFGLDVRS